MNDLISRQGVLDFIDNCLNHSDELDKAEIETLLALRMVVIALPFVNPCDKCRFVFLEEQKEEDEQE